MFFEICGPRPNLALKMMATGGVWLGVAILVKNLSGSALAGVHGGSSTRGVCGRSWKNAGEVILNDRVALWGGELRTRFATSPGGGDGAS